MTNLNEKALEAARKAYDEKVTLRTGVTFPHSDALSSAIRAYLSHLPAQAEGVRVKGLVWERTPHEIDGTTVGWMAECVGGRYVIQCRDGSDSPWWEVTLRAGRVQVIADKENDDDAKAAAQADYEARIRSALELASPPVAGEPVAWIEWHGGECPVDPETRVDYFMRDGGPRHVDFGRLAGDLIWFHGTRDDPPHYRDQDIIAYRPAIYAQKGTGE